MNEHQLINVEVERHRFQCTACGRLWNYRPKQMFCYGVPTYIGMDAVPEGMVTEDRLNKARRSIPERTAVVILRGGLEIVSLYRLKDSVPLPRLSDKKLEAQRQARQAREDKAIAIIMDKWQRSKHADLVIREVVGFGEEEGYAQLCYPYDAEGYVPEAAVSLSTLAAMQERGLIVLTSEEVRRDQHYTERIYDRSQSLVGVGS